MDRKMELDHLALAEKAVADGERHIAREEQMIADLDRHGHSGDTKLACETLAALRRMQAEHIAHRNLILKMLKQDGSSDPIFRPGHYESSPEAQGEPGKAEND